LSFWLGWDGILMSFWFTFPLWVRMFNIPYVFIDYLYFFWELSVQLICPLIGCIISSFGT
jgi:hypothetical protein